MSAVTLPWEGRRILVFGGSLRPERSLSFQMRVEKEGKLEINEQREYRGLNNYSRWKVRRKRVYALDSDEKCNVFEKGRWRRDLTLLT